VPQSEGQQNYSFGGDWKFDDTVNVHIEETAGTIEAYWKDGETENTIMCNVMNRGGRGKGFIRKSQYLPRDECQALI
jgi:hypothetical protein